MKVLLFNPLYRTELGRGYEKYFIRSGSRWPHSGIKRKGALPHYLPFPFFLAYSAAWLKKEGFETATCDCVALDMPLPEFLKTAERVAPDAVFFESTTPTIGQDKELARDIKRLLPSARVILGGPHATVFPSELLAEVPEIDFIVKGEYEETLVELLKRLRSGLGAEGLAGVVCRGGEGKDSGCQALISPLDKLPAPAYDMFPSGGMVAGYADPTVYWDGFCQHRPAVQMHTSRGCPYRCDFCLWNQVMYGGGKYRTFSAERVLSEMEELARRYGAKEIYFDDDDFTIVRAHVEGVCRGLIERKLGLKWSCMGDAINLDEDLIDLMADSGCVGIKFGVETGSPRMLKTLGKPVNLAKVKDVARWCAARGIKTHATFSLGLYGEDERSAGETLSYLGGLSVDSIQVSISTPFPGTRMFDKAEKEGRLKTRDWEKYDGKASEVLKNSGLDLDRAETMRGLAMRRWLLRRLASPGWVLRQARYFLRVAFGLGPAFLFSQARALVFEEKMLAVKGCRRGGRGNAG